jgi:hypothetical protein
MAKYTHIFILLATLSLAVSEAAPRVSPLNCKVVSKATGEKMTQFRQWNLEEGTIIADVNDLTTEQPSVLVYAVSEKSGQILLSMKLADESIFVRDVINHGSAEIVLREMVIAKYSGGLKVTCSQKMAKGTTPQGIPLP